LGGSGKGEHVSRLLCAQDHGDDHDAEGGARREFPDLFADLDNDKIDADGGSDYGGKPDGFRQAGLRPESFANSIR
jgi:hypothetical protein